MKQPLFKILLFIVLSMDTSCKKNNSLPLSSETSNDQKIDFVNGSPNVIIFIGDEIGYEIPTYNGGESYETPNLDFMAANGVAFANYYTHPDGPPGRLSFLTGKYNNRNWERFLYIDPNDKAIGNLMEMAGYKTCFVGKWQLDGGDESIKGHGFQKYLAFMPFNKDRNNGYDQYQRRYKNPYLYENGDWLPDTFVQDKYSEDLMLDYATKFVDSNKNAPFFMVYSHTLAQRPWSPTPDHPDYAGWDEAVDDLERADKKYFPFMIKYMDKIIGKLINHTDSAVLSRPTLFMFIGDNGTNKGIESIYKGELVKGNKNGTNRKGTNVPLVAYSKYLPKKNIWKYCMVDVVDFMPTLSDISTEKIPTSWGKIDGISFADELVDISNKSVRKWNYCYWDRNYQKEENMSFVYTPTYKLYDSLNGARFYNIQADPDEHTPLDDATLTPYEKELQKKFNKLLLDYLPE